MNHLRGHERPTVEDPSTIPTLPPIGRMQPMIPKSETAPLTVQAIDSYVNLAPKQAVAIARAARLYQNGLWLCEASPNDAWLMLVSAVEVVAVEWRTSADEPETILRELRPKWVSALETKGGSELLSYMAKEWISLLGATNRFIKFVIEHLPAAPPVRPPLYKVDWSKASMKKVLNKLYEHRSRALHGGIPFPPAMCRPPAVIAAGAVPAERPVGAAETTMGGTWTAEDMPICLHTFAYIVRGSLLNWWDRTLESSASKNAASAVGNP